MIRSAFLTLAVAAMVVSANAALAGGGRGGSKSNNQNVRIKNIGSAPVIVNAANGEVSAAGGKTVSNNGVAQFRIKKGAAQAIAANQSGAESDPLDFNFPKSSVVYLTAQADANAATMTFANPGQTF